ncbi:Uncharacterised protein [Vibrio cholerae]|uniref:Uncharacterized protein n=1 Tax=Vibrio cholerae TaxID=666 RepID=A0A655UYG8_VIBCL|nr:Uncharacterised protein [Vibrio cholerae]
MVEYGVVPKRRPSFVHDLRLLLWIKILADFTHNTHDFTLPRLQQRGVFLNKIENVFLWFTREAALLLLLYGFFRHGTP